jgi:hypothetical protein
LFIVFKTSFTGTFSYLKETGGDFKIEAGSSSIKEYSRFISSFALCFCISAIATVLDLRRFIFIFSLGLIDVF